MDAYINVWGHVYIPSFLGIVPPDCPTILLANKRQNFVPVKVNLNPMQKLLLQHRLVPQVLYLALEDLEDLILSQPASPVTSTPRRRNVQNLPRARPAPRFLPSTSAATSSLEASGSTSRNIDTVSVGVNHVNPWLLLTNCIFFLVNGWPPYQ